MTTAKKTGKACINCDNTRNWNERKKKSVANRSTLCADCKSAGWKVKKTVDSFGATITETVEPQPSNGNTYYSGYPLYRCGICGIPGGH